MDEPKLDLRVVLGGEAMLVTLLDGTTQTVSVRYLPVSTYPEFAAALDDETHQVSLFANRDRAWAETLHPASHDEIMRKGHELNLDFFERWVSRRKRALAAADPGAEARLHRVVDQVVREKLQEALAASPSPASSPASPPSQASAEPS